MKIVLTMIAFALTTTIAQAQSIPGGIMAHELHCSPVGEISVGSSVALTCYTQALAPKYSLRGCDLLTAPVVPNATISTYPLTMKKQTISQGKLALENSNLTVIVKKSDLSAKIYRGGKQTHACSL